MLSHRLNTRSGLSRALSPGLLPKALPRYGLAAASAISDTAIQERTCGEPNTFDTGPARRSEASVTLDLQPALRDELLSREGSEIAQPSAPCSTYLQELSIRNFALVRDQAVQLRPGLNVITGESGAGKSVLVSALGQVLGAPTPDKCIRPPAASAVVEACWRLSPAASGAVEQLMLQHGLPAKARAAMSKAGPELVLRREVIKGDREGTVRSRSSINGTAVSQKVLRELGNLIADINGQGAAQSLRDAATQIDLLDRLAGTKAAAAAFGSDLGRLQSAEAELRALDALGDEAAREDLQNLVDKIAGAEVEPGEERRWRRRLKQMDARRTAVERCRLARTALAGEGGQGGGIDDKLLAVEAELRGVLNQEQAQASYGQLEALGEEEANSDADEGSSAEQILEAALQHMQDARRCLSEAEDQVGLYVRHFQHSQREYAAAKARLQTIERLLREFRCSSSEQLLETSQRAEQDLERWFNSQGSREEKEAIVVDLRSSLASRAARLSRSRREAAGRLRAAVEACLADLAMPESRFDVRVGWDAADLSADSSGLFVAASDAEIAFEVGERAYRVRRDGLDAVEFLLAAGPAEPLRPLASVASGGERSRLMLALKAAPGIASVEVQLQLDSRSASMGPEAMGALLHAEPDLEGAAGLGGSPLLVLDELDSGVGGRLGMSVGRLLRDMSRPAARGPDQILCITHLPQVAASAAHHVCVRKGADADGRVVTEFACLVTELDRCSEIAAMGGISAEEALTLLGAASG